MLYALPVADHMLNPGFVTHDTHIYFVDFNDMLHKENVLSATESAKSKLRQIQWCYSARPISNCY